MRAMTLAALRVLQELQAHFVAACLQRVHSLKEDADRMATADRIIEFSQILGKCRCIQRLDDVHALRIQQKLNQLFLRINEFMLGCELLTR